MRVPIWDESGDGGGCAFVRRLSDGAGMDSIRSAIKTIPGSRQRPSDFRIADIGHIGLHETQCRADDVLIVSAPAFA